MPLILPSTRRHDLMAPLLCVGILIFALAVGHFREVGNYGVETDFYGAYAPQAENILAGRSFTYRENPPGYMLLLAGISLLTGDLFTAGKALSALAAAFLGWITYLLFKKLFDSRIALATTILLLIATVPYSILAATDLVAAVSILLPLYLLLRSPVPKPTIFFTTGIFAGLAYLVRYNAVFLIPGIGFSLLFINLRGEPWSKRLASFALFLAGVILITSPWLAINWHTHGSPFASDNYQQVAAYFHFKEGDQYGTTLQQAATKFDSLLDVLTYDFPGVLLKYSKGVLFNIGRLSVKGLGFPAYLFAGIGFLGFLVLLRDLTERRLTFITVVLLGYLLLGLVGFYSRYYLFVFPLLFLSFTYFLFHESVLATLGKLPYCRITMSGAIVFIFAACLCKPAYDGIRHDLSSQPKYLLEIAEFLRARSAPSDVIICRKPHLAYLAGLKGSFPLADSSEAYLRKAREIKARYIVYSDYYAYLWPGLKSLGNPDAVPKPFQLVFRHKPTNTLVYEIIGQDL